MLPSRKVKSGKSALHDATHKNQRGGLSDAMMGHDELNRRVAVWLALKPRGNAGSG